MSRKVVVIGHGYTSRLGVIRALGRAGYEVIVIVMANIRRDGTLNTSRPIDCYSKYVSRVLYCPSDQERLITTLLEECADPDQKVIIFTDSDFSAAAVDQNQERLRDRFLFPNIGFEPGAVVAWMDKARQKEAAKEVGLDVAAGQVIEMRNGEYSVPKSLRYPCFVKPLATLKGGKRGLRRCDNESELREAMGQILLAGNDLDVMVEDFKKIDQEYALLGFSDGKDVLIPGIIKTVSLAAGGHFGVASKGRIVPVDGYEDLVAKFKRFVLKTGFKGIFDIDFYKSEGRFYFCEMNFRYGGSGYAYTALGVNLPEMMVRSFLGDSVDWNQKVSGSGVFVNERMCRGDWVEGYVSSFQFRQSLRGADISFIADPDDPEPLKRFKKSLTGLKMNAKRLAKRVLRRNERNRDKRA